MGIITEEFFYILNSVIYAFVAICTVFIGLKIDLGKTKNKETYIQLFLTSMVILGLFFLVGFRNIDVGTDTKAYYEIYWLNEGGVDGASEYLFYWLSKTVKYLGGSFTSFLLLISGLFYYLIFKSFSKITSYYGVGLFLLLFSFLSLFFANSLTINVIRQGLSLALLLYAYGVWLSDKAKIKTILFLFLAFITHTTAIIPIVIFVVINTFLKRVKLIYYYMFFFMGIIISILGIGLFDFLPFFNSVMGDDRRISYITNQSDNYTLGFRPAFAAFNTAFLFIFIYFNRKILPKEQELKSNYELLLKYYVLSSFLFFMSFQTPFSDRWGLFSWIAIPLMTIPAFTIGKTRLKFKTPVVLLFIFIYIFFKFYD